MNLSRNHFHYLELRNKYEKRTPTKGRPSLKSSRKVSDLRKRRMADSLSFGKNLTIFVMILFIILKKSCKFEEEMLKIIIKQGH